MKKLTAWLKDNKFDLLIWGFSIFALGWLLSPLLTDRVIPGWDTTPHFYLFTKMVDYLKMGQIGGYDSLWFGGFPVFKLYGPFPYILMSIPHFLTAGKIGLALSFNLFLFALPFLFLASIWYTARVWFDKIGGYIAMIFGTFFLCAVQDKAYMGVGIDSIVSVGLFTSFFAICLMIFFLGIIERQRRNPKTSNIIWGTLLLTMLITTHAMTLLFTLLLLAIFTFLNWRQVWKSAFLMGILALVLSSFWLIPFLRDLSFSSGQKLGLLGATNDPLFVLFDFPSYYGEHALSLALAAIPTALLLVSSLIGVYVTIKSKNDFWAVAFILTLVILPRQYLVSYFDLPVHYYRYTAHIFALNIFLATAGMIFIVKKLGKLKPVSQEVVKGLLAGVMIVSLMVSYIDKFNLSDNPRNYTHKYNFSEYSENADAEKVMEYLGGLQIKNRVVVPSLPSLQFTLGSPHFFATFLPLNYKISVIPGLLAESALSTQFVLPTIAKVGSSLNCGNTSWLEESDFTEQDMSSMLQRLGLYNVQYVLQTKDGADTILDTVDEKLIAKLVDKGNFSVLELKDFRPFIETTNYKPLLFIDNGGMEFLDFSKEWFKQPALFEMPVIYTKKKLAMIPKGEIEQMSGYIVSMPSGSLVSKNYYQEWLNSGKKLILLNATPDAELAAEFKQNGQSSDVEFIKDFGVNIGSDILLRSLLAFNRDQIVREKVVANVVEDMTVKFDSQGGTLINYSYFPDWEVKGAQTTIYWATPSMMWLFAKGETEMIYR